MSNIDIRSAKRADWDREIADIADLQLGTVKSRLHRGRKLLQKRLYEYATKNGYIKDAAK